MRNYFSNFVRILLKRPSKLFEVKEVWRATGEFERLVEKRIADRHCYCIAYDEDTFAFLDTQSVVKRVPCTICERTFLRNIHYLTPTQGVRTKYKNLREKGFDVFALKFNTLAGWFKVLDVDLATCAGEAVNLDEMCVDFLGNDADFACIATCNLDADGTGCKNSSAFYCFNSHTSRALFHDGAKCGT